RCAHLQHQVGCQGLLLADDGGTGILVCVVGVTGCHPGVGLNDDAVMGSNKFLDGFGRSGDASFARRAFARTSDQHAIFPYVVGAYFLTIYYNRWARSWKNRALTR